MPPRIFLGHGASGTSASMAPFVAGLGLRGIEATAIDLPRRRAEDAVSAWRAAVPDGGGEAGGGGAVGGAGQVGAGGRAGVAVGGHSYGGRVASLAAAEPGTGYHALVLFSYPLHPPGAPERAEARIAHWPRIQCPVLVLSGEADPFARIELLRRAVGLLSDASLVTYPRLGHGLRPVLDDVLDRVAAFLRELGA